MSRSLWAVGACTLCGSTKIQGTAWIYLNTGKDAGGDAPTDQVWCERCQSEVSAEWFYRTDGGWRVDLHSSSIIVPTLLGAIRKATRCAP